MIKVLYNKNVSVKETEMYLLKIAFHTNRENTNILAITDCGLYEPCVDDLLVLAKGTVAHVAYLKGRN